MPAKLMAIPALLIGAALSPAHAQSPAATLPAQTPATTQPGPEDPATYATGKPLELQSREGFWGHVNPFARKKWVHRQIDPIKDRTNELDQLQARNANDIRDVDYRSQAGVARALTAANTADGHALDAANRANAASTLAASAGSRTDALNGTVSTLDQYRPVSSTALPFRAGSTALTPKQKARLDTLAASLASEKGYILEIQGYSRAGIEPSQAMADSVVRYLVTVHQVPLYRIYRTGLGKQGSKVAAGQDQALADGVRVTLLHNSLATMGTAGVGAATGSLPATAN